MAKEGTMIGYSCLNDREKQAYRRLLETLQARGTSVRDWDIRGADPVKIVGTVRRDHPELLYFDWVQRTMSVRGTTLQLTGVMPTDQRLAVEAELEQAVICALDEVMVYNPMSDYERLVLLYEYLQDHVAYDNGELDRLRRGGSSNPMAHNAYGALCRGQAVCDGIAAAFCLLAQRMGYACTVASGKASVHSSSQENHAWNVLRVKDKYYHADPTWDCNVKSTTGNYSYEYFCVDDDTLAGNHVWDMSTLPLCSGREMNWYLRNRCFANNLTQAEEIFRRVARSSQNLVRVRISDGIPIPQPEEQYLAERLMQCARLVGRYGGCRYSWDGNTRCFWAEFQD